MSQRPHGPLENRLLAMLPQEEMARLLPHLEHVNFMLGEVVYESGGQQSYIVERASRMRLNACKKPG